MPGQFTYCGHISIVQVLHLDKQVLAPVSRPDSVYKLGNETMHIKGPTIHQVFYEALYIQIPDKFYNICKE